MEQVSKYSEPKQKNLNEMQINDVFDYSTLGLVSFQGWNRGGKSFNAIRISNGTRYKCKIAFYTDKKYDVVGIHLKEELKDERDKLKPGTLFLIMHKNDAILLKFKEFTRSGKIKAVNPLDETRSFSIDKTFKITLLDSVK